MSAPKVLFNNVITESNVTIDTFVSPYGIEGALNTLTYEFWEFDADTAQVDVEYTGSVNALGLVIENLLNCTLNVFSSDDGVSYSLILSRDFLRNGAYLIALPQTTANYFRIEFLKAAESDAIVRNIMLGMSLEFERCLMGTHSPIPYNRNTEFISNTSGTGQFLGRSIRRKGFSNSWQFNMISNTWGRDEFQQFVENCQDKAYYISWNDDLYPDECALGWTDEDIGLSYTGDAALMQASWQMRAIATGSSPSDIGVYLLTEDGNLVLTEDGNFILVE